MDFPGNKPNVRCVLPLEEADCQHQIKKDHFHYSGKPLHPAPPENKTTHRLTLVYRRANVKDVDPPINQRRENMLLPTAWYLKKTEGTFSLRKHGRISLLFEKEHALVEWAMGVKSRPAPWGNYFATDIGTKSDSFLFISIKGSDKLTLKHTASLLYLKKPDNISSTTHLYAGTGARIVNDARKGVELYLDVINYT